MAQQNAKELDQLLREGSDKFTAKMYTEVVRCNPGKSVVLSASSVLVPLAQLSLASEGATHEELLETIGLPNDDVTKAVFAHLNNKLQNVRGIELKTATKIYVAEKKELNPQFSAIIKDVFNSKVENVDFSNNTETANEINRWVENQTNHRIKDLVSAKDLNASTCSILLNAIYFMGRWERPFKIENTKEEDFHISKDQTVTVSMMHNNALLSYTDSCELNAQLLELPYIRRDASFLVILPNEVDGLATLEEQLKDTDALEKATLQMETYNVDISLPKFNIETKIDLKDVLEEMNVKRVFDSKKAELCRFLKNDNLFVSKAVQKAFIEVNEEGSEAGAANKFEMMASSGAPRPQKSFIANKPFYYGLKIGHMTLLSGRYIE